MQRLKRVLLLLSALLIAGCTVPPPDNVLGSAESQDPPPISTQIPSETPNPTSTPRANTAAPIEPTQTPRPSATSAPATQTATATPSRTPPPTRTKIPTRTPVPTPTPNIDRSCTEPNFGDYRRYWLDGSPWPTPVAQPQEHFWFDKPLEPGIGRFLYNENYSYGYDGGRNVSLLLHTGLDAAAGLNAPILAVGDGTVIYARSDFNELFGWRCNWYGQFVMIQHDQLWQGQPVYTLYGHVRDFLVKEGDRVESRQPIATVGDGGAAISWHLHIEVRVGAGEFVDSRNPILWLKPGKGRGVLAGRLIDPDGRPWQGVAIRALRKGDDDEDARSAWSYLGDPLDLAKPDEHLAENFVFGDLKPGDYELFTEVQGVAYSYTVRVLPDTINTVEIQTLPLKMDG